VQDAPPASELPQVLVWVKSALVVIVTACERVPRFETVKGRVGLVVPTAMLPNARDVGFRVSGAMPVPVTLTDKGLPKPL
jgi:hypothetical protein